MFDINALSNADAERLASEVMIRPWRVPLEGEWLTTQVRKARRFRPLTAPIIVGMHIISTRPVPIHQTTPPSTVPFKVSSMWWSRLRTVMCWRWYVWDRPLRRTIWHTLTSTSTWESVRTITAANRPRRQCAQSPSVKVEAPSSWSSGRDQPYCFTCHHLLQLFQFARKALLLLRGSLGFFLLAGLSLIFWIFVVIASRERRCLPKRKVTSSWSLKSESGGWHTLLAGSRSAVVGEGVQPGTNAERCRRFGWGG